eukprot:CAMPEP_0116147568 /NCGR_PEP_ID=MMETSP0329-20121206/17825_1 /TAXON_ID=697910 /ORGANISM="Pseudo-nitzschia arenysensis, Strain B593" /LENGTH=191 /DNA_ID=CAMNT_0003643507 /DNA_START=86 /DNA_END=661 /DNA_ORIENTATION=+
MAPLIQDNIDLSYSNDDEILFSDYKSLPSPPLHEECEATPAAPVQEEKRVWFASMTIEYDVMSRYEYTREELEASWYDANEMKKIKDTARSEAKLVEAGLLVEEPNFSVRGLEAKTRKGVLRKRKRRTNAYLSVFFEIDSQIEEGYFDDELVADAYYVYSEPCAMEAEKVGKQDALDARAIYNESAAMQMD